MIVNRIGNIGARAMSEMLKVNKALTSLNLSGEEGKKERKEKEMNE